MKEKEFDLNLGGLAYYLIKNINKVIIVLVCFLLAGGLVGNFMYNTKVDEEVNSQLQAEYENELALYFEHEEMYKLIKGDLQNNIRLLDADYKNSVLTDMDHVNATITRMYLKNSDPYRLFAYLKNYNGFNEFQDMRYEDLLKLFSVSYVGVEPSSYVIVEIDTNDELINNNFISFVSDIVNNEFSDVSVDSNTYVGYSSTIYVEKDRLVSQRNDLVNKLKAVEKNINDLKEPELQVVSSKLTSSIKTGIWFSLIGIILVIGYLIFKFINDSILQTSIDFESEFNTDVLVTVQKKKGIFEKLLLNDYDELKAQDLNDVLKAKLALLDYKECLVLTTLDSNDINIDLSQFNTMKYMENDPEILVKLKDYKNVLILERRFVSKRKNIFNMINRLRNTNNVVGAIIL